jgi:kinesin family member C1
MDALPDLYEESQKENVQLKMDLSAARTEITKLQDQSKTLSTKNSALTSSLMETRTELTKKTALNHTLTTENTTLKAENGSSKEKLETLTEQVKILTQDNDFYKEKLFRSNIERKELHNQIMDLRGNIRVFCRIRKAIASEEDRALAQLSYLDEQSLEMCNVDVGNKNAKPRHEFSFDHVFHSHTGQDDIFSNVSSMVFLKD